METIVHRISTPGRVHGWNLRNVQVICGVILAQVQPVDRTALKHSDDLLLCETCADTVVGNAGLLVKEVDPNANDHSS